MNKNALGAIAIVLVVALGAWLVWGMRAVHAPTQETVDETAASGDVIDSEGSVSETADLEAELNATGADTNDEMEALEAEFEEGT